MGKRINKLFLVGLVPLMAMTALPSVALSACGGSRHGKQPEPTPTPTPHKDPSGLPKDYTPEQYEDAMNKYIASVAKMNNEQIVSEVDKVTNKLEQVNQNCFRMYDNDFKGIIPKETLEKSDVQKFYNIISQHTSKKFLSSCDGYIQYAKNIIKEQKGKDVTPYDYGMVPGMLSGLFGAIKSEFFVQQLFILEKEYVTKNTYDFNKGSEQQRHQMLNLMLELVAGCTAYFYKTQYSDHIEPPIINIAFLKNTITNFKKPIPILEEGYITGNNGTIRNEQILRNKDFYFHRLEDITIFCVPFEKLDLSSTVITKP